jgi:hypothetical protein
MVDGEKPKRKRGGPKRDNWIAVRTAYIVNRWPAQRCAEHFDMDVTTIRKRASKEGWTAERHALTTSADRVAIERAREHVDSIAASHVDATNRVIALADRIADRVDAALDKLERDESGDDFATLRRVVEVFDRYADGVSKALAVNREVRGLRSGDASEKDENRAGIRIERRILTPEKIPIDEEGRAVAVG